MGLLIEEFSADVCVKDAEERTVVHAAARTGNLAAMRYLARWCSGAITRGGGGGGGGGGQTNERGRTARTSSRVTITNDELSCGAHGVPAKDATRVKELKMGAMDAEGRTPLDEAKEAALPEYMVEEIERLVRPTNAVS